VLPEGGQSIANTSSLPEDHPYRSVAESIRARADATPDALALSSGSEVLTYGDLEAQASQLAHHLLSLGVGPERLVGVCLDRGPALVVAALAVFKAGAAYIALDPELPTDRLRFMLEDAKTAVLIAWREHSERVGNGPWAVVNPEHDSERIAKQPRTSPEVAVSPQNLAYVIYTSGSTGRPKGVQITHANLMNLVRWHCRAFSVSLADRASQLSNVAFDAAVWEIWPNLVAGSSIHFPDETTRVSAEPLREWLVKERITISFVPTPLAESLITLDWPTNAELRFLLTGGDVLHHYPPSNLPFTLVNNYGPTECTVVTTSGPIDPNPLLSGPPTIGRPIDGFQVYILDEQLLQVPDGSMGELHVGGAGLGRGYLNRPDLDAERFIANPFSQTQGDRLYKTGDLARRSPDGEIVFLGRIDEQIKIRGYRIEPAEIAAVLALHPGIASCVAVSRDDEKVKRLIAYVVATPQVQLTHTGLQDFLKKFLPDYMVPSCFVRVPLLPLTMSGKIDRMALPPADSDNIIGEQSYLAPRNPIETRVAAILSELLGMEQVSVNDNFFFLGGHSLLGTQLIARVRDSFGVELPLRTVFDSPTVEEISAAIENLLRTESMSAD
jgi:amino acid adenylation domain-containing protein